MTTAPMMTTASTPELAREKFAELRAQYVVTRDTIKAKGRSHATAQEEILKLSEVFKQFRLVPKQFDYLVNSMRVMMDRVRTQERLIMKLCVEQCKMPKKNFITLFYRQRNQRYLVQRGNCDEQAVVGKTARCLKKCIAPCKNCSRLKKKPA